MLQADPNAEQPVANALKQAINLDPTSPVLRAQLGNFFLQRGKVDEALDQFFVAIRLKPDWAQAHYDLAQAYKKVGNSPQAQQELQNILLLLPQDLPQRKTVELELESLVSPPATPSGEPVP